MPHISSQTQQHLHRRRRLGLALSWGLCRHMCRIWDMVGSSGLCHLSIKIKIKSGTVMLTYITYLLYGANAP